MIDHLSKLITQGDSEYVNQFERKKNWWPVGIQGAVRPAVA